MDEAYFQAAMFCLVTRQPYGKSYLEMTLQEQSAFVKAYVELNNKKGG